MSKMYIFQVQNYECSITIFILINKSSLI